MGVDVDNDFKTSYSTIKGKGDVVKKLKMQAKNANKIYLASDPDREGEAIAWHIAKALKLDKGEQNRIEFHEITDRDRKSTRLNSSHANISYAVFCLKKNTI